MESKIILYSDVKKNDKYGYWELEEKYRKNMQKFYEEEYYQEDYGLYKHVEYDDTDIRQKNNFYAKKWYVLKMRGGEEPLNMLDIGAGEGYALAYFAKKQCKVVGIDFSSYGILQHNPEMKENLLQGDYEGIVSRFVAEGKRFDFVNADNVLEHVPNPEKFFELVKGICHKGTTLCVTVPNDFSLIQSIAYNKGMIDKSFWVTRETSEHFSYFSVDSLTALANGFGFEKIVALADMPIDFFLLHPNTNYQKNSMVGHDCHVACATLDNEICENSMDKAIKLFNAMAEAGIGREISVFFKLNN